MDPFLKVKPITISDGTVLIPALIQMHSKKRPTFIQQGQLDRYIEMGFTVREDKESGFTFVYYEEPDNPETENNE